MFELECLDTAAENMTHPLRNPTCQVALANSMYMFGFFVCGQTWVPEIVFGLAPKGV